LCQKVELIDTLVDFGADPTQFAAVNKLNMNALDYVHQMLNPPPPIKGTFGQLKEEEKRNYLARAELKNYLVGIAREYLDERVINRQETVKLICFECAKSRRKMTLDTHFKVIAFCSIKCRKSFWKWNLSRQNIMARSRKKFPFETFYFNTPLKDNYSFN
jgi:hypothetical protein